LTAKLIDRVDPFDLGGVTEQENIPQVQQLTVAIGVRFHFTY